MGGTVPPVAGALETATAAGGVARTIYALVRALRPRQFIKNALLFSPAFFAPRTSNQWILNPSVFGSLCGTFALFCLLAGSTYIINDCIDLPRDRNNPEKCHRPIAAGQLSLPLAVTVAIIGITSSMGLQFLRNWRSGLGFLAYFIITLTYSFLLKRMVIIDILTIAALFVLRGFVGCLDLDVTASMWFLSCVGNVALFVATSKRFHEVHLLNTNAIEAKAVRSVVREYNHDLLLMLLGVSAMGAILTYTLFSLHDAPPGFGFTIPFVVYGMFRFLYLVLVRGLGGTPEVTLLKDRPLLATVGVWALTLLLIYYRYRNGLA
jgi:4-hydroxybenzoate polyprenyltransferase